MKLAASFPRLRIQLNTCTFLSLLVAESALSSVLHHRYNFWGWPWEKQAIIILLVAPGVAYALQLLLTPVWPDLLRIKARRWSLFLLPALATVALAASHFLAMPETQHRLEIIPATQTEPGEIRLLEIKGAYGNDIPLSTFAAFQGWALQDGLLVSAHTAAQPLEYSFVGPIGKQVRVTFLASPQGGQARVVLDGQKADLDLAGPDGDQRRARLDTQYRWGFLNFLILPLIVAADLFTFLSVLLAIWLIQEVAQDRGELPALAAERFLSHRNGVLLLCLLGLLLHTVHFLAVPLAVLKDSPSFLQGAVYWIQFHSLDGVSSYRGPGTTFLFTPFMALFGRNPWGLKILLHLMAIACIPLSYRLAWQLGQRRWFAFCVGLLTALLPDLYAYSSYVLSEVPDVLFGLLFCTALISALETLSPAWIAAAALAGSFAVLVRSENFAALVIGMAFILTRLLWAHRAGTSIGAGINGSATKSLVTWAQIALPILIAAMPLFAWSLHNQRTYGFFGISDYGGEILYDGWIYFGESSRLAITDQDSPAVRAIQAAYGSEPAHASNIPTGWDIYYSLLSHGYTSGQAFGLLQQAALDSILKDASLAGRILAIKVREGFEPHTFIPATFVSAGESPRRNTLNADYFDAERPLVPSLVTLQRSINDFIGQWYQAVFTVWFWLGLTMAFISLYRRPAFKWMPLAAMAINGIFLPTIMGMSMWRYVLFGLVLMPIFIVSGIQSLGEFIPHYLSAASRYKPSAK